MPSILSILPKTTSRWMMTCVGEAICASMHFHMCPRMQTNGSTGTVRIPGANCRSFAWCALTHVAIWISASFSPISARFTSMLTPMILNRRYSASE